MTVAPLLTAAMIVRDEEAFLADCLASLRGVVDEVVVVDTGSVDATPDIARRAGARVVHHPWRGDFAEARNVSLEHATGRWVLYIDADEQLVGADRAAVEGLLAEADEVAFRLLLQPRPGTTPYREYRLWRNDPRIRFEGVMHEKVVPAIHRVGERDGRAIGVCDLLLAHRGYEGDQTAKHRRNLPLLRRQLRVEPRNLFAWHHLARVLDGLGDADGAEAALRQAVEVTRTSGRYDPCGSLSFADLVLRRQRRGEDADDLLAEARRAWPGNLVLLWIDARTLMARGETTEALDRLGAMVAVDPGRLPDLGPSYDERLVGELPWDAIGLCHFRLGDYRRAAEAYGRAAACAPGNPAYRAKRDLALARCAGARRAGARSPRAGAGALREGDGDRHEGAGELREGDGAHQGAAAATARGRQAVPA